MIRLTRAAAACILALGIAAPAVACMPPEPTQFRKYPAETYSGERRPVDFSSHPIAAALGDADKEWVRKAVEAGPNFAGAYRAVYAPCGENCNALLVVSLATGKIIQVPVKPNSVADFRVHSNLMIVRAATSTQYWRVIFDRGEFRVEVMPDA